MSINITNLGGTINYHDNHKELTINGANASVKDVVKAFMQDEKDSNDDPADHFEEAEDIESEPILPIPGKRKYTEVRRYIEERCRFDEEFRHYVETHSRVDLCMRLTDEFGWDVD